MQAINATASITNILLTIELFFFSGLIIGRGYFYNSAGYSWGISLFFLGMCFLIKAVNYNLFELRANVKAIVLLQKGTWIALNVATYFIEVTVIRQYFSEDLHMIFYSIAAIQLALISAWTLAKNNNKIITINFLLPVIGFLVMCVIDVSTTFESVDLSIGLFTIIVAIVVQLMPNIKFSFIDNSSLYNLIMITAVIFLFMGGDNLTKI